MLAAFALVNVRAYTDRIKIGEAQEENIYPTYFEQATIAIRLK